MSKLSRRALAHYATDQLIAGKSASSLAKHLAAVMVEAGMANQLEFLLGDIAWELEKRGQLTLSRVTTARPLTKELETALRAEVKAATKTDEVLLEEHIDKSVIGGVRVETASHVWDSTILRKLTQLREVF